MDSHWFHFTTPFASNTSPASPCTIPSRPIPSRPSPSNRARRPVPHILTPLQQGLRFAHGPPSNRISIGKTIGPSLRRRLLHLRPRPSWSRAGLIEALSSYLHGSKAEHRRLKLPVRTPTIHSLRTSSSPQGQGPRPPPLHRVHPNPDPRITMDARGKTSRRV